MRRTTWLGVVLVVLALVAGACGRSDEGGAEAATTSTTKAPSDGADACKDEQPQATEVGVSADAITVTVMADVGSSLAPGLFQGNVDALNAYAKYVNANGGIACRDLVVKTWDSKLNPDESKNGQIDACSGSLAMVGGNALFNPDITTMVGCKDKAGAATGLPDFAALANDVNEMCGPTAFLIQAIAEECPVRTGQVRPIRTFTGATQWFLQNVEPDLHGVYLVPGDLPTTVQSATYSIKAQELAGITWDATLKVSGRDEQAAYTPRIQTIKAKRSNFVYDGSNDRAMINARKEAKAQGVDDVKVWACSIACYTKAFLSSGGADVEGTYLTLPFLPFEEADTNETLKAYVDSIGADKVDSFGAQAWQAATLFREAIDRVVEAHGVNGITRKALIDAAAGIESFDAGGWMGAKDLHGVSDCHLMMQVKGGKFVRIFPEERGTFDCNPDYIATVNLDPAAEAAKIK
jgi:ABC-type branched-subunit amino acid transport system substrate-binding protein